MKRIITVLLALVLSACVKLEVKPQEIVKDTVNTTKDAYDSYKLERDGYVERSFDHSLELKEEAQEADIALQCLDVVRKVARESSDGKVKIVSQSTKVSGKKDSRRMNCKLEAYVKQDVD